MKFIALFVVLTVAGVFVWRNTPNKLRASVWRASRYYLLAALLALILAWISVNFSANTSAFKLL